MSVLVILLKCKAVIHLEEAGKAYAKGEFGFFYYHLSLAYECIQLFCTTLA